jgi:hypothetical protein
VTRTALRWLLAAVAALAVVWTLGPAGVPMYDGIGNQDEPYRYVQPPQGYQQTPPPTTGTKTLEVRNGKNLADFCNTGETAPQISIYIPNGALAVPAGAPNVTMTATPKAPQPPLPADGDIISNVYTITATADGKPVGMSGASNTSLVINMRAPTGPTSGKPLPTFERRTPSGWQRIPTTRNGVDVYQIESQSLGDYALVQPAHGPSSGGGVNWTILAAGIGLLVVSLAILLVRVRRTRAG